ncbi:MAG: penicillin amidase [Acidobacteriota bacterium]|nr:penicillin amidase [Acidobacteriota bacterium]
MNEAWPSSSLSLRVFNLTNHFNPRDVRANTADPQFGRFFAPIAATSPAASTFCSEPLRGHSNQMKKIILLCALLLSISFINFPTRAALTQTPTSATQNKTITLAGLHAPVRVTRDERGIPHIEATNDEDLYFAQGYVTAQDRLWQMDLLRRTARGELAEIFGRVVVEQDKIHRTYGFARIAEGLEAKASTQERAVLEAYARGVNAYTDSLDQKSLPREFQILGYKPRAWRPADSIVIGKNFAEALSTSYAVDLGRAALSELSPERRAELLPDSSPLDVIIVGTDDAEKKPTNGKPDAPSNNEKKKPARVLPATSYARTEILLEAARLFEASRESLARIGLFMESGAVSNNWVVSGKHTATGKPLLANDPHLDASAPSIWHMVQLKAPGINVAGVTAPGGPGVIIGHNEQIAWGMTNLGPDVQDLYLEKFDAQKPNFYVTPTGLREAEVRHEEIKVRKNLTGSADDVDVVPVDVTVTRHGPILIERSGARYALRWTALDPQAGEFDAFYKLDRAHDWDEFRAALSDYRGPTQNFIYADTRGHIGYYGAGVIPIRKSGDGSVPYDGSTDAGEWTSYIPFNELPHVLDPPSGIIVTANARVVGRSYTHFLTHQWADAYRARRIYDLLKDKQRITADDIRAVQGDIYSIGGATVAREAAKLLREPAASPTGLDESKVSEAAATLEGWDGRVTTDSRAAPLVAELRAAFRRRIIIAAVGAERGGQYRWSNNATFFDRAIGEHPASWLPKEFKSYGELMRACLSDARAALTKRFSADESQWVWGRYNLARFPHPLAQVPFFGQPFLIQPFAQSGNRGEVGATVNVGANVSMRLIADTSDWDKTQQGIALGESGDPASAHWSDQLADWRAVTPRAFPFSAQAIASKAVEIWELKPAGH